MTDDAAPLGLDYSIAWFDRVIRAKKQGGKPNSIDRLLVEKENASLNEAIRPDTLLSKCIELVATSLHHLPVGVLEAHVPRPIADVVRRVHRINTGSVYFNVYRPVTGTKLCSTCADRPYYDHLEERYTVCLPAFDNDEARRQVREVFINMSCTKCAYPMLEFPHPMDFGCCQMDRLGNDSWN